MQAPNTFYISTAINYTNGSPHFGHAYEAISADVFARYHRSLGEDVFFATGTDEHGQKVAESAAAVNLTPIQLCDKYVGEFQHLNQRLQVSNDFYVRTTLPQHHATSQWLWKKATEKGDIYHGAYEGWYNIREEKFVTETEAKSTDYKDPGNGKPLTKTKESSFFFKLSKYNDALLKHINENPGFIQPEARRTELLERLKEPLIDLSISRTTFDWGIPIPDIPGHGAPADEKHIMYVWFDALTNYLTSVQYAEGGDLSRFWPASVHLIGKDIAWFHAVIWPCMLMSCDIPLPKVILCHGFVNAADGRKMSKSYGNVVEPNSLLDKYPVDSLRYFCMREGVFGSDFSFNEKSLVDRYDSELQGAMGNLVQRAIVLCEKHSDGKIPSQPAEALFDIAELSSFYQDEFSKFNPHIAMEAVHARLDVVNKWLAEKAPWHMKEDQKEEKLQVVRTILEAVYVISHFLNPVVPSAMEKVFKYLNTPSKFIPQLSANWDSLTPGTPIEAAEHIFPRIQENRHVRKQQPGNKAAAGKAAPPAPLEGIAKVDLRVGVIVSCKPHPESPDRLYVEQIDLGEAEPRQVVSGLAQYVPLEEMQGARVVVVCNMKPSKFKGQMSTAMVLAANSADGTIVKLVTPPAGAAAGERIAVEGYNTTTDAHPPQLNPKKNEWETVKPDLRTDEQGIATYKGVPLTTTAGAVVCADLPTCQLG